MSEQNRAASVLERAIRQGQSGDLEAGAVLWVLAAGSLVILNEQEPPADDFPDAPMIVAREGVQFLAVFTNVDQTGAMVEGRIPVQVPAFELLRRVPEGIGLVVNPGSPLGIEVPAEGLRAFIARLLQPMQG